MKTFMQGRRVRAGGDDAGATAAIILELPSAPTTLNIEKRGRVLHSPEQTEALPRVKGQGGVESTPVGDMAPNVGHLCARTGDVTRK